MELAGDWWPGTQSGVVARLFPEPASGRPVRAGHLPAFQVPLDECRLCHVQEEDVGGRVRFAEPPSLLARLAERVAGERRQTVELQLGLAGVWPADRAVQHAPGVPAQVMRLAGPGHGAEYQLAACEVRLDRADPGRAVWPERAEQGHARLVQPCPPGPGDARRALLNLKPRRHQESSPVLREPAVLCRRLTS